MQTLPCVRPVGVEPHIEPGRWISSREALQLVMEAYLKHDPLEYSTDEIQRLAARDSAVEAILRRLTQGSLLARPRGFLFVTTSPKGWAPVEQPLDAPGGTVPKSFWMAMRVGGNLARRDWIAGDFSFEGDPDIPFDDDHGFAYGIEFDRTGLPAIAVTNGSPDLIAPVPSISSRGAPRKWDWDGALLHLAALAHHARDGLLREDGGDPNQSDIGRRLADWFIGSKGEAPEPSQLRDYGKRFLVELNALKMQGANNSRVGS